MNRFLIVGLALLLFTGLGAAEKISENHLDYTKEVTETPVSQHDEFDTEDKMQEKSVKGGTIANTILAGIIEKDQVKRGMVVSILVKDGQLDDRKQVNLKIAGSNSAVPGKSVEQGSYWEGNDAEYAKKSWGQPSFDDLEMERGVKPGNTKLHDRLEDVRAGSADAARKEVSVKMQKENEWRDGAQKVIIGLAKSDKKRIGEEVSAISKRSARKGRNPQTGKEIKIPAGSGYGHEGREPEEKEVEMIVPDTAKEKPQRGKVVAIDDKEIGEEYFVHVRIIDEIRDEDDVSFELREGRKGMNAVDVRRTD